ncbi:MAG: efflux RND transporter periplasmic adaptor subunit [Candidatus Poribacteria bacterium]
MKKAIVIIVIFALLIGMVVYAYVIKDKQKPKEGMAGGRGPMSVPVETMKVADSDIVKKILVTGTINARAEVNIYPKQSGEIVKLLVDKGDRVKAGQILAEIDSVSFQIQERQADADLDNAKATYQKSSPVAFIKSETDFKQAKSNVDRLKSALRQAELDLDLQIKQADLQVKKANSDLKIAQARLDAATKGAREQELEPVKARMDNAKRSLDRMQALLADEMVSKDQVETAQLQYDIYNAQYSLLKEGLRPEDMDVLKEQVEAAKTALESAVENKKLVDIKKTNLDSAKAQVDSAQAAFEQALATKDASIWKKDLDQAESAVKKAEASLDLVKQRVNESIVRASINGVIAQRFMDKGDTATTTKPFFTIVDAEVVKITAKVPERDIVDIKLNQEAIIKPDAYPGQIFKGKVTNISPIIDRETQTCDIEITTSNPDYKLKPGMFARIELTTSEHKNVPLIPIEAMVKEGDETFVYVIGDGKAVKKKIETGITDGVKIQVVSGLNSGDEFIMAGKYSIREGMDVTLAGEGPKFGKGEKGKKTEEPGGNKSGGGER